MKKPYMQRVHVLAVLISLFLPNIAPASSVLQPGTSLCDQEWQRIKGIPPMTKNEYEQWLARKPTSGVLGLGQEGEADYYYLLARIPFVRESDGTPSASQREEWLQKAAQLGHKSAKAALLRLRYLGQPDPDRMRQGKPPLPHDTPKATREEYLKAVRAAAEAGDPEFATVMMDTAQNINGYMHCQDTDATKVDPAGRALGQCDSQGVTTATETKKWAEISARGGNPNAKNLLCKASYFGTSPELGFRKDAEEAFAWCFSSLQSACLADSNAGLVEIKRRPQDNAEGASRAPGLTSEQGATSSAHRKLTVFPWTTK